MSKKVAIFGSGLSAAYVYAACQDNGVQTDFYTDNRKPEFFGPVKLSWVPAWVQAKLWPVWLFSLGTRKAYLTRMGRTEGSTTFPESGNTWTQAFNPEEVLKKLLPFCNTKEVGIFLDVDIQTVSRDYDYTFVTFPLQQSKALGKLVPYWVWFRKCPESLAVPNHVIYNGTQEFAWTRYSQYWGTEMWEYSHTEFQQEMPPWPNTLAEPRRIADIAPGVPEYMSPFPKVALVGRWARWSKNVLAQDGYAQADKILKELR